MFNHIAPERLPSIVKRWKEETLRMAVKTVWDVVINEMVKRFEKENKEIKNKGISSGENEWENVLNSLRVNKEIWRLGKRKLKPRVIILSRCAIHVRLQ